MIASALTSNAEPPSLFTPGFIALVSIAFLAFGNLAVFYTFETYLSQLGFSADLAGFIFGAFTVMPLLLIPLLGARITPARGRMALTVSLVISALCLALYPWATTLWPLLLLRVVHGIAFTVLLVATTALFTTVVPVARAGMAYGYYSAAIMLPYAVFPPLLDATLSLFGGAAWQYAASSVMMFGALLLLPLIGFEPSAASAPRSSLDKNVESSPQRQSAVLALLIINGVFFIGYAALFLFLRGYAGERGLGDPGFCFTLTTLIIIAVRLFGASLMDYGERRMLLIAALVLVVVAYTVLAIAESRTALYSAAVLIGFGAGLALPLLNALMFLVSSPLRRAFNANMMVLAMQAGFFIGPLLAGILVKATGYTMLFVSAGDSVLVGRLFVPQEVGGVVFSNTRESR